MGTVVAWYGSVDAGDNHLWMIGGLSVVVLLLLYATAPTLRAGKFRAECAGEMDGRTCLWMLLLVCGMFFLSFFHMGQEMAFRERELSQIAEGESLTLQGEIYRKEFKNQRYTVYLKKCVVLVSNEKIACNQVIFYQEADSYSVGETLVLTGKLHRFDEATNEGQFDSRRYYESQKIDFKLDGAKVVNSDGKRALFSDCLYRFRCRLCEVYECALAREPEQAGILETMLLGEKGALDAEIKNLYQSAGISHILAISGLHVSMVGMGLYRFLRRRRAGFLASFAVAFSALLAYASMTGNSISTRRAVGMAFLAMLAGVLGRTYDMLNSLGGMVILLLWQNPFLLWYSGFQFSVVAILVIGIAGSSIQIRPQDGHGMSRSGKRINHVYGSLMVWLGTMPLVAFYYYEIPTYGALLNLLVLPLMPVLFLCGLAGGLVGCVNMGIARIILFPCRLILNLYDGAATLLLRLPKSGLIVGKPTLFRVVLFYAALLALAWLWKKFRERHCIRVCGMLFLLLLALIPGNRSPEVDVLDVGQGDGTFIRTEEGACLFVDGGSTNVKAVGTYRILPFLKAKGADHIDYWLVSHGDEDHISGLKEVMESGYEIDYLVMAESAMEDEAIQDLLALAEKTRTQIVPVKAGDVLRMKKSRITFLWPAGKKSEETGDGTGNVAKGSTEEAGDTYGEYVSADRNDMSLTFVFEDANFRGMFAGDISSEVERILVEQYGDRTTEEQTPFLDVDFYKVNHHGSRYSSCAAWLEAIEPELASVSCSESNSYGHPHEETMERLREVGCEAFRTDKVGAIKLNVNRERIEIIGFNEDISRCYVP